MRGRARTRDRRKEGEGQRQNRERDGVGGEEKLFIVKMFSQEETAG